MTSREFNQITTEKNWESKQTGSGLKISLYSVWNYQRNREHDKSRNFEWNYTENKMGDFLVYKQALVALDTFLFFGMQLECHFLWEIHGHGTQGLPLAQHLLHQTGIAGLLFDSSTRQ